MFSETKPAKIVGEYKKQHGEWADLGGSGDKIIGEPQVGFL